MKYRFSLLAVMFATAFLVAGRKKSEDIFIVKPYLQIGRTPTPETLELLWQTADETADWSVEVMTGVNGGWKKTSVPQSTKLTIKGISPRNMYNVTMTGLTPGSVFNYRVLRQGTIVFTATAQASKSFDQPYRFIVAGDIGAGTRYAKLIAQRAFLSKPDLMVIPGDIVYEHGRISEYDAKFWPVYNTDSTSVNGAPLMRSIPFVAATGNHDSDNRDLDTYPDGLAYFLFWNQPLNGPKGDEGGPLVPPMTASESNRKAFTDPAGEAFPRMANFSFNYGNAHWLFLDSNPYMDWMDKGMIEWVRQDLAGAKDATWRFVVFHHPGFNSAIEHYEQQQMRLLSPLFEAGKVDIVFNGHVHNYQRSFPMHFTPDKYGTLLMGGYDKKTVRGRVVNGHWKLDKTFDGKTRTKPDGIIYIVTGAGGQELYNTEQHDDPDSWQKFTNTFISNINTLTTVDVNGKVLKLRQLAPDGKELDSIEITK